MTLAQEAHGAPADIAASVPALSIQNVSHSYRERRALDGVSFDVRQGAFAVLLGLNGAGKTTLFSLITRLYAAQHGSISVLGFDVAREPAQALSRLGVVFQARTLDLDLTVMQNLLYHASLHGIGGREGRALANETLARTEHAERAARESARAFRRADAPYRDRPRAAAPAVVIAARRADSRARC